MSQPSVFKKAAAVGLVVLTVAVIGYFRHGSASFAYGEDDSTVDCRGYFDPVYGYTSLYEIVDDLHDGITGVSYKTWGTVTGTFFNTSGPMNFYIQSTDRDGNSASMLVYQSSLTVYDGNLVTIEGIPTLYNNLPEFINPSITLDYTVNSSPVISYETGSSFWQNGGDRGSAQFLAAESMGPRLVYADGLTLVSVSSGSASAQFSGGTSVPLYYSSLYNTGSIYNRLQSLIGKEIKLTGYLDASVVSGMAQLRLLIRNTEDIVYTGTGDSLTLNPGSYSGIGSYSTGNYGEGSWGAYGFEHYRAVKSSNYISLLPYAGYHDDGSASGALYNTESVKGMRNIEITYYTDLSYGDKPILSFGTDRSVSSSFLLDASLSEKTVTVHVADADYFRIETSQSVLYVKGIVIEYTGIDSETSYSYTGSGAGQYRINPVTYTGSLYEGASVNVPVGITRNGSSYTVTQTKTYTYYTFGYVQSNPSLAGVASYTEPEDVAAFYTAFKTYPANYVPKSNYYLAYDVFGSDARCVSSYTRTDGYATSVPYKGNPPKYYECDIDLDGSYSDSNRGVGRVVCWQYGFDSAKGATDYDASPVCVYTDDHYATFREYLNTGSFGNRFNSEMTRTDYVWGVPATLFA